jgi:hypothetical protein
MFTDRAARSADSIRNRVCGITSELSVIRKLDTQTEKIHSSRHTKRLFRQLLDLGSLTGGGLVRGTLWVGSAIGNFLRKGGATVEVQFLIRPDLACPRSLREAVSLVLSPVIDHHEVA